MIAICSSHPKTNRYNFSYVFFPSFTTLLLLFVISFFLVSWCNNVHMGEEKQNVCGDDVDWRRIIWKRSDSNNDAGETHLENDFTFLFYFRFFRSFEFFLYRFVLFERMIYVLGNRYLFEIMVFYAFLYWSAF